MSMPKQNACSRAESTQGMDVTIVWFSTEQADASGKRDGQRERERERERERSFGDESFCIRSAKLALSSERLTSR